MVHPASSFVATLADLCSQSLAVTVDLRSGNSLDVVLLACDREVLVYERWSDEFGMPTGDLGFVDMVEIDAVLVS